SKITGAKPTVKPSLTPRRSVVPNRLTARPQSAIPPIPSQTKPPTESAPQEAQSASAAEQSSTADPNNPLTTFPHFPGAQPGCLGVPSCYSTGKALAIVSGYFEKELPNKKYTVQPSPLESDRKVYEISKDGTKLFLSLIFDGNSTLYVLADAPRSLADLQKTVQISPEFTNNILSQLSQSVSGSELASNLDPTPNKFADPNAFFTSLGGADAEGFEVSAEANSEVESLKLVSGQAPQQLFSSFFSGNLQNSGFESTPISSGYGGGDLYQIKKGSSKPFYLNLVPTKDGTSTIVVVWRSQPT
ncbi:MAG: hypothetical protein LH702_28575, partial [Phormidesmis sp. CAN_BIN44]|nr:hypothetical protein [Phormidesmis sp. CAN_BIN44]